jgi:DNA-directed RNA polymerases I, II, and III subunit RPABC2
MSEIEKKHADEHIDDAVSEYDDADVDQDDVDDVDVDVDPDLEETKPDRVEDDNDEDDEDDDPDQEESTPKKRVHTYHQIPESTEIRIVHPSKRLTSEYMTIYEYSMVVGTRATHIANGSILYTDPQGLYDPRDIAKKEINENQCPLSITRKVSPTTVEVWEVNEMIKPQT